MFGRVFAASDEMLLRKWERMTKNAPERQMKRDGAMVSLLFAAKTTEIASLNAQPPAAFGD